MPSPACSAGAAEELAHIGPRYPLLEEQHVVFFGYEPSPAETERAVFQRLSAARFPAERVRAAPDRVATEALATVEGLAGRFALHLDVDVIDFVDFPVADIPQHNAGLTFGEAMICLAVFAGSPRLAALTITEFNPDHADEEGRLADAFV